MLIRTQLLIMGCLIALLVFDGRVVAEPFYVNHVRGTDTNDGSRSKPFKTIARAIKEVDGVGGEIDLSPEGGAYLGESIIIQKGGVAGRPLVIEGHGSIINLGEDVTSGPWTDVGNGFRLERPVMINPRWWLATPVFVNGLPVFSDDPKGAQPKAWHGGSMRYDEHGRLILIFPKGLNPSNSVVVLTGGPNGYMSCAISLRGASYVEIHDVTAAFSANDAFNFHGKGHDVLLDDVRGLFNGDQGTSAHETYQVAVRNSEFAFNGSGDAAVDDIRQTSTTYDDVRVHQNRNIGIKFTLDNPSTTQGFHELKKVVSFGNGGANLPPPSENVRLIDCKDLGSVHADQQIHKVGSPQANVDLSVPVPETDRLERFLRLRPLINSN